MIQQDQVAEFYDMVFPSATSHKIYEKLIPKNLSGKKVGDFGCGQSLFLKEFRRLKYDSIFLDISEEVLEKIDYGLKIKASLSDIPLADDYMDVIFCIGVVHHIPEMEKSISEIMRVLKTGGVLFLGVYADKTISALIRCCYDNSKATILKKIIWCVSSMLIWLKNKNNGLVYNSQEHVKRVKDLLITPLVRYLPVNNYVDLIKRYNGHVLDVKRISSMNILMVKKD